MIHIGPHKTGSTSIQTGLLALDSIIRMRSDYVQPFSYDSGLSNPKTQCQFTRELFHVTNNTAQSYYVEKMQDFFSKAYQQQRNVLLSTEDLSAIPVEGIKYLRNMLFTSKLRL